MSTSQRRCTVRPVLVTGTWSRCCSMLGRMFPGGTIAGIQHWTMRSVVGTLLRPVYCAVLMRFSSNSIPIRLIDSKTCMLTNCPTTGSLLFATVNLDHWLSIQT